MIEAGTSENTGKTRHRSHLVRIVLLVLVLFIVLLVILGFVLQRPRSFYWSSRKFTLSLQTLAVGNPFLDESVWVRDGWSVPGPNDFRRGDLYGLRLGKHLLRLDISDDPLGAIRKNLPDTLPGLLEALESKDLLVKMCAGEALVKMGPSAQSAFPILLKRYAQGEEQIQSIILELSKTAGASAVAPLSAAIKDPESKVRQIAAEGLGEVGSAAVPAIPSLSTALLDSAPGVVMASALSLRKIQQRDHGEVAALTRLLTDKDSQVRAGAIAALAEFGGDAATAVPSLLKILESGDSETAGWTARTIGLIGRPARPAIPRLIAMLGNTNQQTLNFTMEALGRFGEDAKGAIPKLMKLADKEESMWGAISALGSMGPDATPKLVKLYREGKHGQESWAANAFAKQGPIAATAVPALMENLQAERAGKTARAAWVLGYLGAPARVSVPRLIELTRDTDPQVRVRAAEAAWRLDWQTNAVLPVMVAELRDWSKDPNALRGNTEDEHSQSRQAVAAEVLGEIGPAAREAIPLLQLMLQSSFDSQREPAAEALKRIQQQ
jgi:HEAT repeat protein